MCCCRGCRYDPNEALGLPPKSVRAIIGLISCVIIYLVEAYLVIVLVQKDKYDLAISVGGAMLAELSGIIGYYFGSRSSSQPGSQSSPLSGPQSGNQSGYQSGNQSGNQSGYQPVSQEEEVLSQILSGNNHPSGLEDIESQIDNQSSIEE